ncbi:hypothetical protein FJZ48_03725 [Candidatus Uhrbacteria bacterium]|nr:hypothetical protein [Candidatus Uhrbacteria bacterium]
METRTEKPLKGPKKEAPPNGVDESGETPDETAEEAPVATGKVTRVTLTVANKTPLLMDRMSDEMIEQVLIRGKRPPPVRDMSLVDMCRPKLYVGPDGKTYGIPGEMFMAALREAGRKVKVGKSNISTADSTTLFAFLALEEDFLYFPEDCQPWTAYLRRGQMKTGSTTTAAGIVRPKFDRWGFTAHLTIDHDALEGLTSKHVNDLIKIAGQRIGLAGFRPTCNGPFGCYNIARYDEEEVKAAA